MLAKAISNRPIGGSVQSDFARRIRYVCRSASVIEMRGLAGGWSDAAHQMTITAGLRPQMHAPCYHVILSWSALETPSTKQMIRAADDVALSLGAKGHQYLIGLHIGAVGHAHLIINRVHPVSGKVLSRSHDYARLERACRQIEHSNGWPPDRGRFLAVVEDDVVKLRPQPAAHWRPNLRTARAACGMIRVRCAARNGATVVRACAISCQRP